MTTTNNNNDFPTQWLQAAALHTITPDETYQQSAKRLSNLVKTGLLRFTDARNNPEKFFLAHRLLVDSSRGPGFAIRFTVLYNLFGGTVLSLSSPEQVKILDQMQERGELGCFALTEKLAGVNSGLSVETICTWDSSKQCFILNTPTTGSEKNWISQGLTAQYACVIANLVIAGKQYGPHGFIMRLRDEKGNVVNGVTLTDMGKKVTGNDLDNASIRFTQVELPKSALLSRFATIDEKNQYVQTTKERMRIEIIGQRLLTGRVAIAQAALIFTRKLYENTAKYAKSKQCWVPGGSTPLMNVPHIGNLFMEAQQTLDKLDKFVSVVESKLNQHLRRDEIPSAELIEAIAVSKVASAETSIKLSNALKQEVGSYALMWNTGFENDAFLLCCAFAEGDTRILKQKISRDAFKKFSILHSGGGGKKSAATSSSSGSSMDKKELVICEKIASVAASGKKNAWDLCYKDVYMLADTIMERTIMEMCGEKVEFGSNSGGNNSSTKL
jgi:acyl-CoA oxidase